MAEREALQKRYAYSEMSNKVQRADRRSRDGGRVDSGGPTGEVESLWNVLPSETLGRMGDRVGAGWGGGVGGGGESKAAERPAEVAELMERAAKRRKKKEGNEVTSGYSSGKRSNILLEGATSILDDVGGGAGGGGGVYRPTHPASRSAYETLLNLISSKQYLGNQPTSILQSAVEEVLQTLKDGYLKDPERKDSISRLLTGKRDGITDAVFAQMVQMGKNMDDYEDYIKRVNGNTNGDDDDNGDGKDKSVDEEMGVAVVFDDSEEEDDGNIRDDGEERSDVDEDVVVDVGDSSSDEGGGNEDGENLQEANDIGSDEERIVQGTAPDRSKGDGKGKKGGVRILSVYEIDAHYLQRRLALTLDDADECARLADQVLGVLDIRPPSSGEKGSSGTSLRECENQLLVLLGFERFDLIKTLLANRARIWGCVSLKRATDEETRDAVETALMEEETGEGRRALEELRSRSMAEDWKGERMKTVQDTLRKKERGDGTNESPDDIDGKESKMSKALDSIKVQSVNGEDSKDVTMEEAVDGSDDDRNARELDFDSLAFREGSHTMSNKKCDLPDKSWRAMKPGYEEVHVPAVRSVAPPGERLVPIAELPSWTHDAFAGMTMLNRVQSKMAEVALRTSENILLCAPTGASY